MSIRKNTNPRPLELPPEMRDLLARNGMRGHIAGSSEGFVLLVQGHDSPLLSYPITEKQLQALTDWGTNYANRRCYNTFASIVAADFDLPRDFVHARTPTDEWPWGYTATASVRANTDGLDAHFLCATLGEPASSAGHPASRTASTCDASAVTFTIPAHR